MKRYSEHYPIAGGPTGDRRGYDYCVPNYVPEDVLGMHPDVVNDMYKVFSVHEKAGEMLELLHQAQYAGRITPEQRGILFVVTMTYQAQNNTDCFAILKECIRALSVVGGVFESTQLDNAGIAPAVKEYLCVLLYPLKKVGKEENM